jgi:hypothetical protein
MLPTRAQAVLRIRGDSGIWQEKLAGDHVSETFLDLPISRSSDVRLFKLPPVKKRCRTMLRTSRNTATSMASKSNSRIISNPGDLGPEGCCWFEFITDPLDRHSVSEGLGHQRAPSLPLVTMCRENAKRRLHHSLLISESLPCCEYSRADNLLSRSTRTRSSRGDDDPNEMQRARREP